MVNNSTKRTLEKKSKSLMHYTSGVWKFTVINALYRSPLVSKCGDVVKVDES